MWATLTAGRVSRCFALADVPAVLNVHVPWRKCPSRALMRGSPDAVTVATASTFMPVSRATSCSAVRVRSSSMMLRRCPVALACEASSRACRTAVSSDVSSIL